MRLASLVRPLSLAVAALAATACTKTNPDYCGSDPCPIDAPNADASIDTPTGCMTGSTECTEPNTNCIADVCRDCDTGNNLQNVNCTEPGAPICGADLDCRACAVHEECTSGVCDAGRCATDVLYVRSDGDDGGGNQCTSATTPCKTVTRAIGQIQASDPRRFIKLMDANPFVEPSVVTIDAKDITIVGAPGPERSVIDRSGNGLTMQLQNGADVRLERVSVSNATNNLAADGINCSSSTLYALGIEVDNNNGTGIIADNCTFTLMNSIVSRSDEGGVSVQGGRAVIVNNVIVDNGGPSSSFGGLLIQAGVDNASIVQSNTLAGNRAGAVTQPDGIDCQVTGLTVRNTIIFGATDRFRVNGACAFANTLYGPTDPGVRLGALNGNMLVLTEGDFSFVDSANRNYHIGTTSAAKGRGSSTGIAAEATKDIDGEMRPQGTADVGADEIP